MSPALGSSRRVCSWVVGTEPPRLTAPSTSHLIPLHLALLPPPRAEDRLLSLFQQQQLQHLSHQPPQLPLTPHPSGVHSLPGGAAGLLALSGALMAQSQLAAKEEKAAQESRGEGWRTAALTLLMLTHVPGTLGAALLPALRAASSLNICSPARLARFLAEGVAVLQQQLPGAQAVCVAVCTPGSSAPLCIPLKVDLRPPPTLLTTRVHP